MGRQHRKPGPRPGPDPDDEAKAIDMLERARRQCEMYDALRERAYLHRRAVIKQAWDIGMTYEQIGDIFGFGRGFAERMNIQPIPEPKHEFPEGLGDVDVSLLIG